VSPGELEFFSTGFWFFVEENVMAQVSESTSSIQEAVRSLQSQSPRQSEQVQPDRGETAENGRSERLDQQKESNSASQARQSEDRVLISRDGQNQTRESRVEEGARNVDNLRPPSEQRANERGAAQKLRDQNEVTPSGTRNYEGGVEQSQPEEPPENNTQEVNPQRSRTESREQAASRDSVTNEASDNKNSEVKPRELQDRDETLIEPKKLSKSAEEIEGPRERAEAAKETVFDIPSQRIIEKVEPGETAQAKFANNSSRSDQAGSNQQPPNPASVQTETGQNIDDLI
jgi:hypothetical protein